MRQYLSSFQRFTTPRTGTNLGTKLWNALSPNAREAANMKFLERAVARGADIFLSTNPADIRANSPLDKEVKYLLDKGFKIVADPDTGYWKFAK